MPGYTAHLDTDHADNDDMGRAANVLDAATKCSTSVDCKGFNSAGYYKKWFNSKTQTYRGVCLYSKGEGLGSFEVAGARSGQPGRVHQPRTPPNTHADCGKLAAAVSPRTG